MNRIKLLIIIVNLYKKLNNNKKLYNNKEIKKENNYMVYHV